MPSAAFSVPCCSARPRYPRCSARHAAAGASAIRTDAGSGAACVLGERIRGLAWRTPLKCDAVAAATGISGDDLAEMLPSGNATVFGSRVGWALTYMSQAGLATRPKRGVYVITDRGRTVLDEHPERVDNKGSGAVSGVPGVQSAAQREG